MAASKCAVALLLLLFILAGCAVGPNYHRPPVAKPDVFEADTQPGTNSFADLPWWQIFGDDTLQLLIRRALTNNYDLKIAVTRVDQARAVEQEARAGFFPQVNYAGIAGAGKNVTANSEPSPTGATGSVFAGDVNAAWQLDIFGLIRRQTEAARAQYFASREARNDVMAGLVSEIAQDYFQLLALDRELKIARDTTNSYGQSLKIFSERLKGGVASKLETSSAEALMASTAATIPQLEQRIALQEYEIKILLGEPPGSVPRGDAQLDGHVPPEVPAGLPSALLERRPDIREAEQQLRAANAQVGVAEADMLPQLNLSGLLGEASTSLAGLTAGGSFAWSAAASLTGPLFQGGRLRAQYHGALAARDQYVLQYQGAVLYALQQVSGALISRQKLASERVEQAHAVAAYEEALRIAQERYRQGQSSYYEVLQEQQLLFPAENALVETQLDQLTTVVQLYRALGGGWQTDGH